MTESIYVWYRIGADPAQARASVAALLADVARRTGIAGRLLARADDPNTWMEVYEPVSDATAFARVLADVASARDVQRVIGAERHVERFAPLESN